MVIAVSLPRLIQQKAFNQNSAPANLKKVVKIRFVINLFKKIYLLSNANVVLNDEMLETFSLK